jgi:hypothetical protein
MMNPKPIPSPSQALADQFVNSADAEAAIRISRRAVASSGQSRKRRVRLALVVAVPLLIAVLTLELAWQALTAVFDPAPSPAMARLQAQAMLDGLVGDVRAFQKDYHELPARLIEVGVPPRGKWSYVVVTAAHFRIQGTVYGQSVSFDSATGPEMERR